ncbi:Zinc finger FYVE domain-containing protein 9 [Acromyrmex echinatior]|uniref:Zinc finger FYVE domain-containing protein 9 n=1 Tax=Acromyrmex echinatior TaxID=103372 RepID=F4WS11_ACREC|nr:Zinc finger FYVE domain-containing protein 9 [Acromyrmex echinatior]
MRRQNHPPLDNTTNSYIPHDSNLFPPTVTIHKGQIIYHPPMDESVLYKTLKNECEPSVMFAINHNLYAYVKITNLNCCVNKICWNVTSRGLACIGQDEIILLVEVLPDETRIPKDLLTYINQLYLEAIKGNTVTELGFSVYQSTNLLLGSREHVGFLFIRQTLQCLQKIILPPAPFLIGLLVHRVCTIEQCQQTAVKNMIKSANILCQQTGDRNRTESAVCNLTADCEHKLSRAY